jgi:hypothetical protein
VLLRKKGPIYSSIIRNFERAGVWEGFFGAFAWMLFLVVATILAFRGGIDILEYYQKAAGIHH